MENTGTKLGFIKDINDDDELLEYVKRIRVVSLEKMTEDLDNLKNGSVARVVNEIASGLASDVYKQKELRLREGELDAQNEAKEMIFGLINEFSSNRTKNAGNKTLPSLPEDKKPDLPETVKTIDPKGKGLEEILEEFKD